MEELPPTGPTDRPTTKPLTELAALIGADGLSRFGTAMTVTAVPWFVLVTTGSAARTGVVVFASGAGVVLALLFGGAAVDRISFRRASVLADLGAGCMVALIPTCYLTVGLPFWLLILLVFLGTLLDIPALVARYSTLPDISQEAGIRFERSNSIFGAVGTISSIAGPAAAGILIAIIGARNVLWFDAGTFWISSIIVATLMKSRAHSEADEPQRFGYLDEIASAFRFVVTDSVLLPLVVVLGVMNVAIGPIESVIIPVLARNVFHSSYVLGLLASSFAIGALGGNVIFGMIGHRLSRVAVFGLGFLTVPGMYALLSVSPGLAISVIGFLVVGLGLSLTDLLEYTIKFERLPRQMRARGLGLTGTLDFSSMPIGRIVAGFGIASVGLTVTLAGFALLCTPLPLALLGGFAFQNLNTTATTEAET